MVAARLAGTGLLALLAPAALAQTFLGPTPYASEADSPFAAAGLASFYLEDFEDGLVNTAGLTAAGGVVLAPGALTDSVDGDSGPIDGSGISGSSYFSGGVSTAFDFSFDTTALGGLPTHAGVVWTDVGAASPTPGAAEVTLEAFDAGNNSLGVLGPFLLGDGVATGGTAEDRFFGVIFEGGISRIGLRIAGSTDWEADHVQYGIVPEPASWTLLGLSTLLLRRR